MEGIDDYIYLLVILVAGLSSLLKKRKKQVEYSDSELPDMDDVLPEIDIYEEVEPQFQPEPLPRPTPNPVFSSQNVPSPMAAVEARMQSRNIATYETVKDAKVLKSRNHVKSTPVQEIEAFKQVEEVPDPFLDSIQFDTVEDAKRAFVYAEIFNRKY